MLSTVLTGAACRASKRSLIVWCAVSGQVPCSGARRRDKVLDEVSTAVHGDAVAVNNIITVITTTTSHSVPTKATIKIIIPRSAIKRIISIAATQDISSSTRKCCQGVIP
jgi:hypothetical protein